MNEELKRQANGDVLPADASRSASMAAVSNNLSRIAAMANASRQSGAIPESLTPAGEGRMPQNGKENLPAFKSGRFPLCGDSFFDESLTSSCERTPVQTGLQSISNYQSLRKDMESPRNDELETSFSRSDSACGQKKTFSTVSYMTPISNVKTTFDFKSPGSAVSSAVKPVRKSLANVRVEQQAGNEQSNNVLPGWTSNRNVNQLMNNDRSGNYCVSTKFISSPDSNSAVTMNVRDRPLQASTPG